MAPKGPRRSPESPDKKPGVKAHLAVLKQEVEYRRAISKLPKEEQKLIRRAAENKMDRGKDAVYSYLSFAEEKGMSSEAQRILRQMAGLKMTERIPERKSKKKTPALPPKKEVDPFANVRVTDAAALEAEIQRNSRDLPEPDAILASNGALPSQLRDIQAAAVSGPARIDTTNSPWAPEARYQAGARPEQPTLEEGPRYASVDVVEKGREAMNQAPSLVDQFVDELLRIGVSGASYSKNPDGSFDISIPSTWRRDGVHRFHLKATNMGFTLEDRTYSRSHLLEAESMQKLVAQLPIRLKEPTGENVFVNASYQGTPVDLGLNFKKYYSPERDALEYRVASNEVGNYVIVGQEGTEEELREFLWKIHRKTAGNLPPSVPDDFTLNIR